MSKIITKASLREEALKNLKNGMLDGRKACTIAERSVTGNLNKDQKTLFGLADVKRKRLNGGFDQDMISNIIARGGAMHCPQKWADGSIMSAYERVRSGKITGNPQGSSNTLLTDWAQLFDALRLDITVAKEINPTMRQYLYNMVSRPDASLSVKLSHMLPYGVIFEKNNGTGQSVTQGDKMGGLDYSVDMEIFSAGFTWDLLAQLFDKSLDMSELSDAVARGYNSKTDDTAFSPIFAYDYGTKGSEKYTAKDATAGLDRQELLYRTLSNALDDLAKRKDPITKNPISVSGAVLVCSDADARHINQVIEGLPSANQKKLGSISEISSVLAYTGETISMRDKSIVYDGCPSGTAYLCVPKNRLMTVIEKQGLTTEVDLIPDVKTLAREEYAYYYVEAQFDKGVEYFVQKIELPVW